MSSEFDESDLEDFAKTLDWLLRSGGVCAIVGLFTDLIRELAFAEDVYEIECSPGMQASANQLKWLLGSLPRPFRWYQVSDDDWRIEGVGPIVNDDGLMSREVDLIRQGCSQVLLIAVEARASMIDKDQGQSKDFWLDALSFALGKSRTAEEDWWEREVVLEGMPLKSPFLKDALMSPTL